MLSRAHLDPQDLQAPLVKRESSVCLDQQESMEKGDLKATWVRSDLQETEGKRGRWVSLDLLVWMDTKGKKATVDWMTTWFR